MVPVSYSIKKMTRHYTNLFILYELVYFIGIA
jgi:hypothetical protein